LGAGYRINRENTTGFRRAETPLVPTDKLFPRAYAATGRSRDTIRISTIETASNAVT
jgi:hypothetical protein